MKTLNTTATITLNKLVSMIESNSIKIDNSDGTFMPVSVEEIFNNEKYKVFSVAHYYEQNGELLADPEMVFIYHRVLKAYMPCYFKQENIGIEQNSVIFENGEIMGIRTKMQADHTEFANMWLRNIKNQQNL